MSEPFDPTKTIPSGFLRYTPPKSLHYLTVVESVVLDRAVPITAQPLVIGRDASRTFHLPDQDVSRAHCEVRLAGKDVLVRDLGSTNGTFIDGTRLKKEQVLPVSSELRIGRHAFRHELLGADEVAKREQFAKEIARARQYVESLIPAPLTSGPVHVDWCFVPSSVLGGDTLGYHALDDGRLALYVIDVCGHGVASAMHSASVLNAIRGRTLPDADFAEPATVLRGLNAAFAMDEHGGMFFSAFYAVLDPRTGSLKHALAGHPPAIVLGRDGLVRERLSAKNPPIGVVAQRAFAQAQARLELGERLFLFSDGVFELCDRSGKRRGFAEFERDLVDAARDASFAPRRLYDSARDTTGTGLLDDDFTLLVAQRGAPAG